MGCPFHDSETDDSEGSVGTTSGIQPAEERGLDRREFMKSALVIGGSSALSTLTGLYGMPEIAAADEGHEPISVAARSNRQHAWDAFEESARGTSVPPPHHLILLMDYQGEGDIPPGHRRETEQALREIERHFEWSHDGVLFTIGYSPQYFDRYYDESLPTGLDPDEGAALMRAETTIDETALDREDITADEHDAVFHMASDHVSKLMAVEEALWGGTVNIDGDTIEFDSTFEGIFDKPEDYPDRRVGFAGHGTVEENLEEDTDFNADQIPEDSDLSMGFNPLYKNSVPRETNATLLEHQKLVEEKPPGVFAQGSIEHLSKLDIDLDGWYKQSEEERRYQMFSPHHNKEHFEEDNTASVDGDSSAAGELALRNTDYENKRDIAERTQADADTEDARIGHAQKTARARFDLENRLTEEGKKAHKKADEERDDNLSGHDDEQELETVMLRRDIDTTDGGTPGVHFIGLMRFNGYMSYMRQAMNGVEFDTKSFGLTGEDRIDHDTVDIDQKDSGIVGFLTTQRRGNFLVPPITVRALPYPQAAEVDISVSKTDDGDTYRVEISDKERPIDTDTVRFGWYLDINRGGGAEPSDIFHEKGKFVFDFPADETGLDDDKTTARFFAKHEDTRKPIRDTVEIRQDNNGDANGDDKDESSDGEN